MEPFGIPHHGGFERVLRNELLTTYTSGSIKEGTQLPNFVRCSRKYIPPAQATYGTTDDDQKELEQWMPHLQRFNNNSHLRGTCLLTGQHATVDMTSNYKTSTILFSSVNVLFMLTVVLWITASFALFYIGGRPKLDDVSNNNKDEFNLEDGLMSLAIVWNVILVILILVPEIQKSLNIPLNNVVIAIVALIVTIFVQWKWANFHTYEDNVKDMAAYDSVRKTVVEGETPPPVFEAIGGSPGASDDNEPVRSADSKKLEAENSNPEEQAAASMFITSNFLSTATAFQRYGAQYYKYMPMSMGGKAGSNSSYNGIRHRKGASWGSSGTGSRMARMPNYVAMINTGRPIAVYAYMENINVIAPSQP